MDLSEFLGTKKITPLSIGQNCNTAWYLQESGAKQFSGPFDWLCCSADILKDCLENDFSRFLDKELIFPWGGGRGAGHRIYHSSMFVHRNPLASIDDYEYYVRCVERFLDAIANEENPVFIATLLNETEKRAGWVRGFDQEFPVPLSQSHQTYMDSMGLMLRKNPAAKFVFIDQYTEQSLSISSEFPAEHIFAIRFTSSGKNSGTKYMTPDDDKFAIELYKGFLSS